uniref:J domain-containing protein n=1 Tax=Plectus sambesii TaxID=2011161 RepID=A0A914X936_9BILA
MLLINPTSSCIRCQRQFASCSTTGRRIHSKIYLRHWHCRDSTRLLSSSAAQRKRDYYEVLGVDRFATQRAIRDAYISKSKKLHPDRNAHHEATTSGSHDNFVELQEAYEVLRSPSKRADYDSFGHFTAKPPDSSRTTTSDTTNYRSHSYRSPYESWQSHFHNQSQNEAYSSSGWSYGEYYSRQSANKHAHKSAQSDYQPGYNWELSGRHPMIASILLYTTVFVCAAVQIAFLFWLGGNIGKQKKMSERERLLAEWRKQQELSLDGTVEADSWTPLHDEILKLGRADREAQRFIDFLAR